MKVLIVEPGYAPYEKEIEGLQQMQSVVGGRIEAIYPFRENVALVCNEEGICLRLPFNRSLPGEYGAVLGTFFICGLGEENFCSLTPEQMKRYKKQFFKAEVFVSMNGKAPFAISIPPMTKKAPKKKKQKGHDER